jgi:hypothetical protein
MAFRRGRSWVRVVVFGALLAGLLGMTGCKRLDLRKLEGLVRTEVETKTGTTVTSVTCPEKRDIKQGDEFQCTMVAGGMTFTVNVKQIDDEGNVEWSVRGITDPAAVAGFLQTQAAEKLEAAVVVDCGTTAILMGKGATFTCKIRPEAGGDELPMVVTITDDEGSMHWEIKQPGEESAPAAAPTP